jgi:hypothetical protein
MESLSLASLPGHSRLWFFQCERLLEVHEIEQITQRLEEFLNQWTSHGAAMVAGFALMHRSVAIIALDEKHAAASGCGIDKCFRLITSISNDLGVDLLSRNTVLFRENEEVKLTKLNHFWAMKKAGLIHGSTQVVDTTITHLSELTPGGWKNFENTWHNEMWSN